MIPINSGSIDYYTYVFSAIDTFVQTGGPLFLQGAMDLLTVLATIMLTLLGISMVIRALSHHHSVIDLESLFSFLAKYVMADFLLRYYTTPMPFSQWSVSGFIPNVMREYTGVLDLSSLNLFLGDVHTLLTQLEHPGFGNFMMVGVYWMTLGFMVVLSVVLFAVTILGFFGVAMATVFGPLVIPWILLSRTSHWFWNWFEFFLKYSFYRVAAAAVVFIWSTAMVAFFRNVVAGDYTLANMLLLVVPLGMFCGGMALTAFMITSWVNDLFHGTAAAGGAWGAAIGAGFRGAFASGQGAGK